jgi:hypothetical protein
MQLMVEELIMEAAIEAGLEPFGGRASVVLLLVEHLHTYVLLPRSGA